MRIINTGAEEGFYEVLATLLDGGTILSLAALFIVVFCRNEIKSILPRIRRVKVPGTSAEIEPTPVPRQEATASPQASGGVHPTIETPIPVPAPESAIPNGGFDQWIAALKAIGERDVTGAKKAFTEYARLETNKNTKLERTLHYSAFLFTTCGDEEALRLLQSKTEDEEWGYLATLLLGGCYEKIGDSSAAELEYRKSLGLARTDHGLIDAATSLARCLLKQRQLPQAKEILMTHLKKFPDGKHSARLWEALAESEEINGNVELKAVFLEMASQLKPGNEDALFNAAYAQAAAQLDAVAAMNYSILLDLAPNAATAHNNLGVACVALGLPLRSVQHYRSAEQLNYSLAMANLAKLFLDAGFGAEASSLVEKARQLNDPHPNIASTFSDLTERMEKENLRWTELQKNHALIKGFFRRLAMSRLQPVESRALRGNWQLGGHSVEEEPIPSGSRFFWGEGFTKYRLSITILNGEVSGECESKTEILGSATWTSMGRCQLLISPDKIEFITMRPDATPRIFCLARTGG